MRLEIRTIHVFISQTGWARKSSADWWQQWIENIFLSLIHVIRKHDPVANAFGLSPVSWDFIAIWSASAWALSRNEGAYATKMKTSFVAAICVFCCSSRHSRQLGRNHLVYLFSFPFRCLKKGTLLWKYLIRDLGSSSSFQQNNWQPNEWLWFSSDDDIAWFGLSAQSHYLLMKNAGAFWSAEIDFCSNSRQYLRVGFRLIYESVIRSKVHFGANQ